MTNDQKKETMRLSCIDDFMIAEILSTSDEEILSQVDISEIEQAKANFQQSKLASAKKLFEQAKAAVKQDKESSRVVAFDKDRMRAKLNASAARDSSFDHKLTLAARNGSKDAEEDMEGILEDLAELEADLSDDSGMNK